MGIKSWRLRVKNKISVHENLKYINDLDEENFNFDVVINLAGATIAEYWTQKNNRKFVTVVLKLHKKLLKKFSTAKIRQSFLLAVRRLDFMELQIQ